MNTKLTDIVSKYLLLSLLIFTGFACEDDKDAEDTSAPVLVSQNIEEGATATAGYVELVFSKPMRQAPETEIYFNNTPVTVSINYEKVRYTYSVSDNSTCTFEIPAGSLTDMSGRPYNQDFFLTFTAESENDDEERVFDAVVDPNGNGDYKTVQEALDDILETPTSPYLIFVAAGDYNECIRVTSAKSNIHLIGEGVDKVKIQYAVNRIGTRETAEKDNNLAAWAYSINNEDSPARLAGYSAAQQAVALIDAEGFYAENIAFINLCGALGSRYEGGLGLNGQAEAMMNRGDRFALNNCKLVSWQDTWWARPLSGDITTNRSYAYNTLIEGRTDYVWGSGRLLVENSTFHNTGNGSYITAAGDAAVFAMRDCTVEGENGITATSFGRPYGVNTTVWINTKLEMDIIDAHWTSWSNIPTLYGEYNTIDKDGNMIAAEEQVGAVGGQYSFTSRVLTDAEADEYTYEKMMATDSWNPKAYMEAPTKPLNVSVDGSVLSWSAVDGAKGYLIFMNGTYWGQTFETSVELTDTDASNTYTVRAVSQYGSLSAE